MSAISLASSIVQFAQLGTRLVLEGLELYQSNDGVLAKNRELEAIVNDINSRSKVLVDTPNPPKTRLHCRSLQNPPEK